MRNKINSLQVGSLIFMVGMAPFMGIAIFALLETSGIDAYLSVLIGGIMGFLFQMCFHIIADYEPDLSLPKKMLKLYGKKIGWFCNVILILSFMIMGISIIYNLSNFIISQFLSETPPLVIGLVFSLLVGFLVSKEIETISRTSLLLFMINILFIIITILGLYPDVQFDNFKPFLENGISRPLKGSFYYLVLDAIPLITILMIPKNTIVDKEKLKKVSSIFYILMIFMSFLVIFLTLGCLGIHLASFYQYPEYVVLKRISFFSFLDRIENIVTSQWIFFLFIALTFFVYSITHCIQFKSKGKILPYIISFTILFLSQIFFKNNTIFNDYSLRMIPIIRIPLILLIIITVITIKIKKKLS